MILIVTHSDDLSVELVIRHLKNAGASYFRLNTDLLGTLDCYFGHSSEPFLHVRDKKIYVSDLTAIWARRFAIPQSLARVDAQYVDFVRRELATVMDGFLEAADCFQMNRTLADRLAGNRLLQSQRAVSVGLRVPACIVTQSRDEARQFIDHHKNVVTKALSFGRLKTDPETGVAFTSVVSEKIDLDGLDICPSLFQERVDKKREWRVTIVGQHVFAAYIDSLKGEPVIDWRAGGAAHSFMPGELPGHARAQLLSLMDASGLAFGAHDLVETPDGEFIFLETNPAGQWGWLELENRLEISSAIASELSGEK